MRASRLLPLLLAAMVGGEAAAQNRIDAIVSARFRQAGFAQPPLAADAVFLRRVHLDVIGTLPYPPDILGSIAASPDGRTLYYGAQQSQANIWLVKRPATETTP